MRRNSESQNQPQAESMQTTTQNQEQLEEQQQPSAESAGKSPPAAPPSAPPANINPAVKRQKSHQRASVACASCRDRRIRCVVPPGETECTQCKRSKIECIIKNDDERRRPISRAYMASLTDRVNLLETMLKERGAELPPPNHPPKTRAGLPRTDSKSPQANRASTGVNDHSSPGSQNDDSADGEFSLNQNPNLLLNKISPHLPTEFRSPPATSPGKKEGIVGRLLSTKAHLSFDQFSGRLRYYGPTTNCHVLSELGTESLETVEALEQTRRAEKIIRFLSIESYEYLMSLFWQHYNSVLHVLHQEAFSEDRDQGRVQFYSSFLHICVLAMGYRFADKSRPDMQRIALPYGESTLHREAKYMLDHELEKPGGIPSVVAMLLLGDLECGVVGRDNVGWLYSGMAVRLAFDIGLHLDTRSSGLPQREIEIRHMTLWACVIYDKYWALFLGRPTSMKSSDLEVYGLSKRFERLGECRPAGHEKSLETQIYEALLDLMELAGKITENMDPRLQGDLHMDHNAYLRMASLDREMNNWYSRLPEQLKWTPANVATAPFSFFLLHQQFHSALILLHRPFAMYEDPNASDSEETTGSSEHFSALSRIVCTKNAVRVAVIFWQHRQRFNTRLIFVTGLQHAGTAAIALVAAIASAKDPMDRSEKMQYLECLSTSLQDMAQTYHPAERMSVVVQEVIAELKDTSIDIFHSIGALRGPVVPARRGSTNDEAHPAPFKRRQTSRSRSIARLNSSSGVMANGDTNGKPASPPQPFAGEGERTDGFILATPRSDGSKPANASSRDGSMVNGLLRTPNSNNVLATSAAQSTWVGPDPDSAEIVHLASIHFPEIPSMPDGPANPHFDFVSQAAQDEWRDWQMTNGNDGNNANGIAGENLDCFSSNEKFGMPFPVSPGRFGVMMSDMIEE
ncbi:hypothetical protein AJ80_01930 [Polytolypa hystricis UAMH7299]|uniref:Zn(2)-C6 fungal-type domain-containing protein n=1 Tax=Polytolypa hystricis (strain UAMH7299) TaxID=1447883 RepID=A0A2B7Z036_POLH7|nr:hypothetical protein AJ80_01930 [Polytolypa hystricis UAMH7299]